MLRRRRMVPIQFNDTIFFMNAYTYPLDSKAFLVLIPFDGDAGKSTSFLFGVFHSLLCSSCLCSYPLISDPITSQVYLFGFGGFDYYD